MRTDTDPATGVLDPDKRNQWLVPPWPADARFSDVVRHFLPYWWHGLTTAHQLAYFEGYKTALDNALADESPYPGHNQWVDDMRCCINRCVTLFRDKLAAETEQAKENVLTLQALTRVTRSLPLPHIKAS